MACRQVIFHLHKLQESLEQVDWPDGEAGAASRASLRGRLWGSANLLNSAGKTEHRRGGKRGSRGGVSRADAKVR